MPAWKNDMAIVGMLFSKIVQFIHNSMKSALNFKLTEI
jgi:hypothetical protein